MTNTQKQLIYETTLDKFRGLIEHIDNLNKEIEKHKKEISELKKILYFQRKVEQ